MELSDPHAFLFSLTKKTKHAQLDDFTDYAIRNKANTLLYFGAGDDLQIVENANQNRLSKCNIGYTYGVPEGITVNSQESQNYLAGSLYFTVLDMDVYQVIPAREFK